MERHKQFIILIGMKHCGKTTIGRMLANKLHMPFFDLDRQIELLYDPERKTSFRDIFKKIGKTGFQALELDGIDKILDTIGICALGGGTIENKRAMEKLSGLGTFIYISEAASVLFKRIMKGGMPAFLDPADPWNDFLQLYEKRTAMYEETADIIIAGGDRDGSVLSSEIIDKLLEEPDAG